MTSLTNTNEWAKAGVMLRESLTTGSRNAMMLMSSSNGASFQSRASTGGSSTGSADGTVVAPRWLRLVRQGNTLTGYHSADGFTWVQRGTSTIALPATVYIGLAVTSHLDGTLATAVFDNVAYIPSGP